MTTTDTLLNAIKEAGYNNRQVSVRNDRSSTYILTIRDSTVQYDKIKAIEQQYEQIDRCPATHEILLGGNTYIDIKLSENVRETWSAHYLPKINDAIGKLHDANHGQNIDERFIIYPAHFWPTSHFKVYDETASWLTHDYQDLTTLAIDLYILTQADKKPITADSINASSSDGSSITASVVINEEKDGVEIYFTKKPDDETITKLKGHGFRWSKYNKCWYKRRTPVVERFAKSIADNINADVCEDCNGTGIKGTEINGADVETLCHCQFTNSVAVASPQF
jgi:hypothetical protein